MAYCRTKHELSVQDTEPSWIKLQVDAHQSSCTLYHLIDEATQNGGVLPLTIANRLRLPIVEKPGNAWVGTESQNVIIYDGQQLLVG